MKIETYQRLKELQESVTKPKVSVSKSIGDYLIVRKCYGAINFKTYEDAEKGIEELLNAGWDIRVGIKGSIKPAQRKTAKGIMDNIKK
jgi:hypothetical protein